MLRLLRPAWLSIFLMVCLPALAGPKFNTSQIVAGSPDLMVCDMDGDGLNDLILMDGLNVSIFYQDAKKGFTPEPQQSYQLEHSPCVVWTAKMGSPAGSLLVMTSDGVTQLRFTNRTGPPVSRQIIRQATIIPDTMEVTNLVQLLPLSVETGHDWPLLLVPAADGLQVWQHGDEWHKAQVLDQAMDARQRPFLVNPGYIAFVEFNLSVGDVNGDGRDDVMVRHSDVGGTNTYRLYLQQTNGLFAPEPALTHADKVDLFSWLYWADLNHDGKVDLIKSVWLNEPSFVPGAPSGKVLIRIYMADAHGRIPAEPQQVLRKNDWLAALPVLDVDGDGLQDLVLGYGHMDSREGLRKEITAKQLDYTLRFFFQRPGAGFPTEADCQRDVVIHLERAESPFDWEIPLNFARSVKMDGDFNGDGKKDLLVRDHGDTISIYFFVSREQGFSQEPDLRFNCPEPIEESEIVDLNNDGVSDLIVKLAKQKGYRIFISQK